MLAAKVHHISFAVRDLARARRFYEEILGLAPIPRPDLGIQGIWYGAGNAEVHLIQAPEGADLGTPVARLSPLANHQAFAIEDYEAARRFLASRGVEVLETSVRQGQMWIRDPDGNVIELTAARP